MSKPLDPEFMANLERFGKEALASAETRGRNGAIAAMKTVIRRMRMQEATKDFLLRQIDALRHGQSGRE